MNLCPCGARGIAGASCGCTPQRLQRHRERLSRALLDRFDLALTVPRPRGRELAGPQGERSSAVRARVLGARVRLREALPVCTGPADELLERAVEQLPLSGRGHARVARIAATI